MRHPTPHWLAALAAVTTLVGCGDDSPCPRNQALDGAGVCVCAPGTFQGVSRCERCAPGQYCEGGAAPAVACGVGTWDHDADPSTPCAAWRDCEPGTRVIVDGDATTDRTCEPCADETYTSLPNETECAPWTHCTGPAFEVIPGSPTGSPSCLVGWVQQFFSNGASLEARAADFDSEGRLWVGGVKLAEVAPRGVEGDLIYFVFEPGGAFLTGNAIPVAGDDQLHDLTISTGDACYIAASTYLSSDPEQPTSLFRFGVVARIPAGEVHYISGEAQGRDDEVLGVTTDPGGAVVATGFTRGIYPDQINYGELDAWVMKYAGGAREWVVQFGTEGDDRGRAIAADSAGEIFVVGEVAGSIADEAHAGGDDVFVRRLRTDGEVAWTRLFGTSGDDEGRDVAVDWNSNVFVGGLLGATSFVKKLSSGGDELWTFEDDRFELTALTLAANGDVVVAGHVSDEVIFPGVANGGGQDIIVLRLAWADGELLSLARYGTSEDDFVNDVTIDDDGGIALIGWTYGSLPGYTSSGASDAAVIYIAAP